MSKKKSERKTPRSQRRYLFQVLLLVPVMLAVWWGIAVDHVVDPFVALFRWLPPLVFPDAVAGLQPSRMTWGSWEVVTRLSPADAPHNRLVFVVPVQRLSLGLPIFWALQLPTPTRPGWRALLGGSVIQLAAVPVLMLIFIQFQLANYTQVNGLVQYSGAGVTSASSLTESLSYLAGGLAERVLPFFIPIVTWLALNPGLLLWRFPTPRRPRREPVTRNRLQRPRRKAS